MAGFATDNQFQYRNNAMPAVQGMTAKNNNMQFKNNRLR